MFIIMFLNNKQNHNLQEHLTFDETVNLGSYYTPEHIVDTLYYLLQKNIADFHDYKILDTSCGSGNFLSPRNSNSNTIIGADIDAYALQMAQKNNHNASFFQLNALHKVARENYGLTPTDKTIIIGNPPYNDTTSHAKKKLKKVDFQMDDNLKARDLGISFLLSYHQLSADYVCVLHPLSFLIKKTNFNLLKSFKDNYHLIDSLVFSSAEFHNTSKTSQFPIIIALYQKHKDGMNFETLQSYPFKTMDGKKITLNQFDYIENYISKYPSKKTDNNDGIFFWTMRDMNALKRNQTFISYSCDNAIHVSKQKLPYYCYVDIFKRYLKHVPYYLGNLSIPIHHQKFLAIQDHIMAMSLQKYPFLHHELTVKPQFDKTVIDNYFKELLKEHYVT